MSVKELYIRVYSFIRLLILNNSHAAIVYTILKDTEYADDAALLPETLMAVVALTNYLADEREEFG